MRQAFLIWTRSSTTVITRPKLTNLTVACAFPATASVTEMSNAVMKAVADTSPAHAGPVRAAQAAPKVSLRRVNIARARWQIYPAAASLPPMELSQKCAIGCGAGQRRNKAPRRSFWSPRHVTSEHWLDASLPLWLKEHIGLRQ